MTTTPLTPVLEKQIRDLGLSLKLQMDFAASADMTNTNDALTFSQKNHATALLMIDVIQGTKIKPQGTDADVLQQIVDFAKQHNSTAGDTLETVIPKVRAVNDATLKTIKQKQAEGKAFTAEDLNKILRKNLKP